MNNIRFVHKVKHSAQYEEHSYLNLNKFLSNNFHLQLYNICEGVLEKSGEYSFRHGISKNYTFEFCEDGVLTVMHNKRKRLIGKGCVFIEAPGMEKCHYLFRNTGEKKVRRYAFTIFINGYFEQLFHLRELDMVREVDMEKIVSCISALMDIFRTEKECSSEEISIKLFAFLTYLTTGTASKRASASSRKEKLDMVRAFPQSFPNLKSLEDFFEVSVETLYQIFKKHTGQSPMDFVIQAKLLNSCWMLLETQYSIGEIAGINGYDSPAFYSNAFKKRFGFSPSMCRKTGFTAPEARAKLESIQKNMEIF